MGIGIYSTAGCLPSTRWQYDMFGADGTVGSAIMSPSDMMGALNDTLLFNSNCDVNRLVASSTALYNFTTPMINSFMAQLAQYWQQMMTGLSSSNNFNVNAPNTNFDFSVNRPSQPSVGVESTERLSEDKLLSMLDRLGKGSAKDRINQVIEIDGKEMTLLERLKALIEEYQKDPENAALSKENYQMIWDILDEYSKTGTLSSENLATLRKIALDPKVKLSGNNEDANPNARSANYANGHYTMDGQNQIVAETFFNALDGACTNQEDLASACKNTDKYNVIEVLDKFDKINKFENDETLIESIFDDCNKWGNGVSKWYNFGCKGDDAKPYVESLATNMYERAQDISELSNCSQETKDNLKAKSEALQNAINAISDKTLSDDIKSTISNAFNELRTAIKEAEIQVYGKEN